MINLNKKQPLTNNNGMIPNDITLQLTYRVVDPKGLMQQLTSRLGGYVDLDATLLFFNIRNEVVSVASPEDRDPFGNQIAFHTGDAKAESGGSASEIIKVKLAELPSAIHGMILAIVAYGNKAAMGKLSQLVFTLEVDNVQMIQEYLNIESGVEGNLLVKITRDGRRGWIIEPFVRSVITTSDWRELADVARIELMQHKNTMSKKGCFIATAVYGDYDAPEVLVLRAFRDKSLMKNSIGRLLVAIYYAISPSLAKIVNQNKQLHNISHYLLDKIVEKLNRTQ